MGARAHRGGVQRLLAAWFAALLAVASLGRPFVAVELTTVGVGLPEALVAQDHAHGKKPVAGLLSAQPFTPGILSRLAPLETILGLPPVKGPVLRPAADRPVLARSGATPRGGEPRGVLQSSAVGTARNPTGPPA